jgi:hypothetical protein
VRLNRYKAKKAGYPAVMANPNIQGMLRGKAHAVKGAADSSARPGAVYGVEPFKGSLGTGYLVTTENIEAMVDEFHYKTLTKAAGRAGAGGGR